MSLALIILLIVMGICLILVEILVIPGISVAGIGGLLMMVVSLFFAYKVYGVGIGNYVIIATIVTNIIAIVLAFRNKTWKNVGLGKTIDNRIEQFPHEAIKAGDSGLAVTRLAPIGKAMINNIVCEAKSIGDFIPENSEVIVIKTVNNQVIVKTKN